jgi:hypothetical protein
LNQSADEPIPEIIRRFIIEHINSVESLEILLLLSIGTVREYTAEEVSRTLCTSLESAAARLRELHRSKLLAKVEAANSLKYRFDPAAPGAALVAELEKVYKTRRVSVISFIYSNPTDPLRAFSDAFRLRKDES